MNHLTSSVYVPPRGVYSISIYGRNRSGAQFRIGRLTQRLECFVYTEEVGGSNPSSPTNDKFKPNTHLAYYPPLAVRP
jgi:hypothetical protein